MQHKAFIHTISLWFVLLFGGFAFSQNTAKVGEITELSVNEVSGETYVWELYDISQGVNFVNTPGNCPAAKAIFVDGKNTGSTVKVSWKQTGEYFYKITAHGSCSNNLKIGRILILAPDKVKPPTISVSYDCQRGIAKLTASDYTGKLLWNTGATSESIEVQDARSYTVTQTVEGRTSDPASLEVHTLSAKAPINVSASPSQITKGVSVNLSAEAPSGEKLHWYLDVALTKKLKSTTVSPTVTTTYYVVAENQAGCMSVPVAITVYVGTDRPPKPNVNIAYDCANKTAMLRALDYTGTLEWSTKETTESITVKEGKVYTVVQIINGVRSAEREVVVDDIQLAVPENIQATPPKIEKGGSSILSAEGCQNGTLHWFADKELKQELTDTRVSPTETTTYYVVCEGESGCTGATGSVTVSVEEFSESVCKAIYKKMKIEQFLSPNGDGDNDEWNLSELFQYCKKCRKDVMLRLYNRWGALVYEKQGYMLDDERFDGHSQSALNYSSELLPQGVYFYIITTPGEEQKKGFIYLIRTE